MDLLREDAQACLRANSTLLTKHSIIYQRSRGCLECQLHTTSLTQLTDFATVYSASSRNEHQQYFLGSKGGRCVGLTTCNRPAQGLQDQWSRSTSYTFI